MERHSHPRAHFASGDEAPEKAAPVNIAFTLGASDQRRQQQRCAVQGGEGMKVVEFESRMKVPLSNAATGAAALLPHPIIFHFQRPRTP